jgi:hypothetical protein
MFQTVNGVQIREHTETKSLAVLQEKRFEIEYLDHVYLNKLVCIDIINIPVKEPVRKYGFKRLKDRGRMWMYVIKHKDFDENRRKYGEVCTIIHEKLWDYLENEYGLSPVGTFIIDSMERVYINS